MGWGVDMLFIFSLTIILNDIPSEWGTPISVASLVATVQMIGLLVGSYLWGWTSDIYGRMFSFKRCLFVTAFFGAV